MFRWYFFLLLCSSLSAQTNNSPCYVKFVSADDSLPLSHADLSIDISTRIAFSNAKGVATVDRARFHNDDSVILSARSAGHLTIDFYSGRLKSADTFVLYMPRAPHELDMIEITRYEVPLIEPTLSGKKRGRKNKSAPVVVADTIPAYTAHEMAQYDSLRNGTYVIPDSIRGAIKSGYSGFYEYLKGSIRIPESAIVHKEEGTIYMQFDIDSNGYVQHIVCVHGNCPAFALQVADVLARTPPIPPPDWEAPCTQRKSVRYQLPVRLKVQ